LVKHYSYFSLIKKQRARTAGVGRGLPALTGHTIERGAQDKPAVAFQSPAGIIKSK